MSQPAEVPRPVPRRARRSLGTAGFVEPIVHEAGSASIVVETVPVSAG